MVRDGTVTHLTFRRQARPIQDEIESLLDVGSRCDHAKLSGMCRELLAVQEAMWTFVRVSGVEPPHNLAERSLRHAVLWRNASFGTHSLRGSRFVERMLTVVYLSAAAESARARVPRGRESGKARGNPSPIAPPGGRLRA